MPAPPPCPWCGETLPRMMVEQYSTGLDDLPCPRCRKPVPERLLKLPR